MGAAMPSNKTRVSPVEVATLPSASICAGASASGPALAGNSRTISPGETLPPAWLAAFRTSRADNSGAPSAAYRVTQRHNHGTVNPIGFQAPRGYIARPVRQKLFILSQAEPPVQNAKASFAGLRPQEQGARYARHDGSGTGSE